MSGVVSTPWPQVDDDRLADDRHQGHMARWAEPSATVAGFAFSGAGSRRRIYVPLADADSAGAVAAADFTKLALQLDPPRARATRVTAESIASATVTPVTFTGSDYNTGGALGGLVWNSATAMVCSRTGLYQFGGFAQFDPATTGVARRLAYIATGAGVTVARNEVPAMASMYPTLSLAGDARWANGDEAYFNVYQESGVAINLIHAVFWCRYICD